MTSERSERTDLMTQRIRIEVVTRNKRLCDGRCPQLIVSVDDPPFCRMWNQNLGVDDGFVERTERCCNVDSQGEDAPLAEIARAL